MSRKLARGFQSEPVTSTAELPCSGTPTAAARCVRALAMSFLLPGATLRLQGARCEPDELGLVETDVFAMLRLGATTKKGSSVA